MKNKTTFLFISLTVREGEREHNHKVLFETQEDNIDRAVYNYLSNFWGESIEEEPGVYYAINGEIAIYLNKYVVLTQEKYEELHNLFY